MFKLAQAKPVFLDWVGPMLLCCEEISRIPNGIGGVYLLHSYACAYGGYPVFYAGRTNNIRRRLRDHVAHPRAKASIRHIQNTDTTYFSAAPVRPDLIPRVEAFLIRLLHPICNKQVPTATPLLSTLPPMAVPSFEIGDDPDD